MDGTRRAVVERSGDLRRLPRIRPSSNAPTQRPDSFVDRLASREILAFMTMWITVLVVAGALEPPPADPNAAPVLGAVLMTMFLAGTGATAFLALTGSRFHTAAASLLTGGVAIAMTVACPAVGHHHLAPWWFAQLLVVTAPTAWSFRQLRASTRCRTVS